MLPDHKLRPCLGALAPSTLLRVLSAVVIVSSMAAQANHWPAWRGPEGTGVSREKNLPLRWSTNENVRWRAPLPDRCNSTPNVWGNRIFVTQAIAKEDRRTIMYFDRQDGKLLWQSGVTWTDKEPTCPDKSLWCFGNAPR